MVVVVLLLVVGARKCVLIFAKCCTTSVAVVAVVAAVATTTTTTIVIIVIVVVVKKTAALTTKFRFMFMFRSKKTHLTKQLLKVRKRLQRKQVADGVQNETGCTFEDDYTNISSQQQQQQQTNNSESVETLLKRLQDNQLDMLLKAVLGLGRDNRCNCVLLPRELNDSEPHMVCCRTWRWPDLRQSNELKQLPMCRSASDPIYICCNPYHWSRLCQPGRY